MNTSSVSRWLLCVRVWGVKNRPMVQDPHNIGSEYVAWVGKEPQEDEEEVAVGAAVSSVGAAGSGSGRARL